jgi:hypothetical protein
MQTSLSTVIDEAAKDADRPLMRRERVFGTHPSWAHNAVGAPQGVTTVMRVKDGGKSEGPAVIVGIRVATLPDVKAGRLPPGLPSRENLANRHNKESR